MAHTTGSQTAILPNLTLKQAAFYVFEAAHARMNARHVTSRHLGEDVTDLHPRERLARKELRWWGRRKRLGLCESETANQRSSESAKQRSR